MKLLPTKSLYYNDVNLIARVIERSGNLASRKEVPEEYERIIASPMEAVVGETFVKAAAKVGISVFLNRLYKGLSDQDILEKQIHLYKVYTENQTNPKAFCYASVGLNNAEDMIPKFLSAGIKNIGVDTANGYTNLYINLSKFLRKNSIIISNMYVGNVNDRSGLIYLHNLFSSCSKSLIVRVGIGGGSPCSTSDAAGINRGNITEIYQCSTPPLSLIAADGGIKKPGYAAKAFAAGANYIMLGGYFAKAKEAETHVIGDGTYWGGASEKQLSHIGKADKPSEGKILEVQCNAKSLKELVDELWMGIASYVTYSGYASLSEAIGNGVFEIKQNSLPPKDR